MVSIDHLFINLKSWTINYCFEKKNWKKSGIFYQKICTNAVINKDGQEGASGEQNVRAGIQVFSSPVTVNVIVS